MGYDTSEWITMALATAGVGYSTWMGDPVHVLTGTVGGMLLVGVITHHFLLASESEKEEVMKHAMAADTAATAAATVIERHDLTDEARHEAETLIENRKRELEWAEQDPIAHDVLHGEESVMEETNANE